jgi:hypothetical protein
MDKYCLDCHYYQGNSEVDICCCYLLITDKRRPCPPGKGCTVKVKRKRRRKTDAERRKERRLNNG